MHDEFSLRIELGNDAMRSPRDARLLSDVARKLVHGGPTFGTIQDINGNSVGYYGFTRTAEGIDPISHRPVSRTTTFNPNPTGERRR